MARDSSDGPDPLFRFVGVVEMDGRPIPVVNEHVYITHSPESLKKIPFLLFDPRTNERVNLAQSIGDDGEDEEVEMLLFILAVFMKAAAFLRTNERLGVTSCTFELCGDQSLFGGASIHPQKPITCDGKEGTTYFMFVGMDPSQDQTPLPEKAMYNCFFPEEMPKDPDAPTIH